MDQDDDADYQHLLGDLNAVHASIAPQPAAKRRRTATQQAARAAARQTHPALPAPSRQRGARQRGSQRPGAGAEDPVSDASASASEFSGDEPEDSESLSSDASSDSRSSDSGSEGGGTIDDSEYSPSGYNEGSEFDDSDLQGLLDDYTGVADVLGLSGLGVEDLLGPDHALSDLGAIAGPVAVDLNTDHDPDEWEDVGTSPRGHVTEQQGHVTQQASPAGGSSSAAAGPNGDNKVAGLSQGGDLRSLLRGSLSSKGWGSRYKHVQPLKHVPPIVPRRREDTEPQTQAPAQAGVGVDGGAGSAALQSTSPANQAAAAGTGTPAARAAAAAAAAAAGALAAARTQAHQRGVPSEPQQGTQQGAQPTQQGPHNTQTTTDTQDWFVELPENSVLPRVSHPSHRHSIPACVVFTRIMLAPVACTNTVFAKAQGATTCEFRARHVTCYVCQGRDANTSACACCSLCCHG